MNYSNHSGNTQNDHLGVNKVGKNIKKSPIHQPNFANTARQQPQPQVYNINKHDFRTFVQQVTGSPSRESVPLPPQPPKPSSMRLQKVRPPPLNPINLPNFPLHPAPPPPAGPVHYSNNVPRPSQFGQLSPTMFPPMSPGDLFWGNTAESPISAYMKYLQSSMLDSGPRQMTQPQFAGPIQSQPQPMAPPGLLNSPPVFPVPSPRMNGLPPPLLSPSQYPFPSPNGFSSFFSPRSPHPLLSPSGYQFPPPLTPNFSFSPMPQSGLLSPVPQHPPSPGISFPLSPIGFLPLLSPRWREQ